MINRSITPDTFFENALPALTEIYYSSKNQFRDMIPELANFKTDTKWGSQTTEQTGVGKAVLIPEGSSMQYDDIMQGNSKTFTYLKYGIGVKITEEMVEDDQWDQINDIYRSLGASIHHIRQELFFDNFNNGFSTNGYDGVPLFSTAHPLVKAGGTQANRPTTDTDLSDTSLQEALTIIANWLTHEGFTTHYVPSKLLVSTAGIYDAKRLTNSDYRPGTANNDINVYKDYAISPVYSPYLTDVDAWFLGCTEHKLMFIERKAPQMRSQEDFDAGCVKSKVTTRFDTGHGSWFGWFGSSGN